MNDHVFKEVAQDLEDTRPSVVIKGATYRIEKLGGLTGILMFQDMASTLGTPLTALFQKAANGENTPLVDEISWVEIAAQVCQHVRELKLQEYIEKLLKGVMCEGVVIADLDQHFAGSPGALIDLFKFALVENFKELFTDWAKDAMKAVGYSEIPTLSQFKESLKPIPKKEEEQSNSSQP